MPAEFALALLVLLPQHPKLLGVVEDMGDAFLPAGRRLPARLGFLRSCRLDAAVLDAAPQLVDGQADAAACFRSAPWWSRVFRKAGLSATASPSCRVRARSLCQAAMASPRSAAKGSTAAPWRQPFTACRISPAMRTSALSFAAARAAAVPWRGDSSRASRHVPSET